MATTHPAGQFEKHEKKSIPLLKGCGLCYIIYFDAFWSRTVAVILHAIVFKTATAPEKGRQPLAIISSKTHLTA